MFVLSHPHADAVTVYQCKSLAELEKEVLKLRELVRELREDLYRLRHGIRPKRRIRQHHYFTVDTATPGSMILKRISRYYAERKVLRRTVERYTRAILVTTEAQARRKRQAKQVDTAKSSLIDAMKVEDDHGYGRRKR